MMGQDGRGAGMRSPLCNLVLFVAWVNMLSTYSAAAVQSSADSPSSVKSVHLPYATSKGPGEPTWNDAAPADAKRALMASMPKSNPNHPHHTSDWHNPNARTRQLVAAAAPAVPGSTSAMTATTKQYFGTTWLSASVCQNAPNRTNSVQDTYGRLWGWEQHHTCAFRSSNGSAVFYDGYVQVKWETSPACTATPNMINSMRDAEGRLWGWEHNKNCAFKDSFGKAVLYSGYTPAADNIIDDSTGSQVPTGVISSATGTQSLVPSQSMSATAPPSLPATASASPAVAAAEPSPSPAVAVQLFPGRSGKLYAATTSTGTAAAVTSPFSVTTVQPVTSPTTPLITADAQPLTPSMMTSPPPAAPAASQPSPPPAAAAAANRQVLPGVSGLLYDAMTATTTSDTTISQLPIISSDMSTRTSTTSGATGSTAAAATTVAPSLWPTNMLPVNIPQFMDSPRYNSPCASG
eukprot:jgi/Chrzof1/13258/Cz07g26150.t1